MQINIHILHIQHGMSDLISWYTAASYKVILNTNLYHIAVYIKSDYKALYCVFPFLKELDSAAIRMYCHL